MGKLRGIKQTQHFYNNQRETDRDRDKERQREREKGKETKLMSKKIKV